MRKQAVLGVLRGSDHTLCCVNRTRCKYSSTPCDRHRHHDRVSLRRFSSTRFHSAPGDQNPASADDVTSSIPKKTSGWGSAPTFKRRVGLSSEEQNIRESLLAAQKASEKSRPTENAGKLRSVGAGSRSGNPVWRAESSGATQSDQRPPERRSFERPTKFPTNREAGRGRQSPSAGVQKCFECGETGHLSRECPRVECNNCGETGHTRRDCPQSKCNTCGRLGHITRDCSFSTRLQHTPFPGFTAQNRPSPSPLISDKTTSRSQGSVPLKSVEEKRRVESVVKAWTPTQVVEWLKEYDVGEIVIERFTHNDISGASLLNLQKRHLKEMGIYSSKTRGKLLSMIRQLRENLIPGTENAQGLQQTPGSLDTAPTQSGRNASGPRTDSASQGNDQLGIPVPTREVKRSRQYRANGASQPIPEFNPQDYSEASFSGFRTRSEPSELGQANQAFENSALSGINTDSRNKAAELEVAHDGELDADGDGYEHDKARAKKEFVDHKKLRKEAKSKRSVIPEDDDIAAYDSFDDIDDFERPRRAKRKGEKEKKKAKPASKRKEKGPTPIYLPEFISVSNLADALSVRKPDFLTRLQDMGFDEATYDHVLDAETAGLIAAEFNFEPLFDDAAKDDLVAAPAPVDTSALAPRPPVVTIMGHVDHGKTTILDWLRKSSVAASEHGGITQHIGAFSVMMPSGKLITFLDTPGHSAFLDMRRRGANVTDIVILVIAADDSVKPQTLEAIKHAKEASVPMVVAINKIDKPDIDVERVKQDLARHGVNVEDFGGDVQTVGVSGKTGQGMRELEEATVTLSEMLDIRADPGGSAEGWIIEAATKKAGRVATVLVRRGVLKPGHVVVAGKTWARIRSLRNEAGVEIQEATPGTPVAVDGWRDQPMAGDEVLQAENEQKAKGIVELRVEKGETQKMGSDMSAINVARRAEREKRRREELAAMEKAEGLIGAADAAASEQTDSKSTPFIVKADVAGSVEAVVNSITSIGNNETYPTILGSGVGKISPFDIKHAAVANGMIVTFNQPTDPDMIRLAQTEGVEILKHTIIYELLDDIKAKLSEKLAPIITHRVLGEAEIAQIFDIRLKRRETHTIAGSRVKNGLIGRSHKVKVLRGDEVIYNGTISSLKNVKKDVVEMRKGTECGISFDNWSDFEIGDQIQTYEELSQERTL